VQPRRLRRAGGRRAPAAASPVRAAPRRPGPPAARRGGL